MDPKIREEFPALHRLWNGRPLIYLDSAATALKPHAVIDAVAEFDRSLGGTVHRGVYGMIQETTKLYRQARRDVAQWLGGVDEEEVIFTRGTTASLNLVAQSMVRTYCQKGDVILLTEIEHHSNLVPWQMVAAQYGLKIEYLPVNDRGELSLDAPFPPRTRIVSFAQVSNVLGTCHPVEKIVHKAKEVGAWVVVDGAQSVAHRPIQVREWDVDFFAFSGHKLYGPTGIGVLYGKKRWLEEMIPIEGGGDMIDRVTLEGFTVAPLPCKFEAGTPMIEQAIGLGAAVRFLRDVGIEKIQQHEQDLLTCATNTLLEIPGLRIVGAAADKGPLISFIMDGIHPLDLATFLDLQGVAIRTGHHCSQPAMARFGLSSTCRLSFGMYNTAEEIEQFAYLLRREVQRLR